MIYRRLGYQKVNRDERHQCWTRAYLAHKRAELIASVVLIALFAILFIALLGVAWTR